MRSSTRESLGFLASLKSGISRVLNDHADKALRGNKSELARRLGIPSQRVDEYLSSHDTGFFPWPHVPRLAAVLGKADVAQVIAEAFAADVTCYEEPVVTGEGSLIAEDVEKQAAEAHAKSITLNALEDGVVNTAEKIACQNAWRVARRESAESVSAWTQAYEQAAIG